ncbi:MAG: CHASE2 domain-containing protein, partial [Euryarchaeota archaeon]
MNKTTLLKIFYILTLSIILCIASLKTKFITSVDGFFYDASLSANFYIKKFFNLQNQDSSRRVSSIVIAIDESTLSAPEAQVPRAMFSPLFADITRKALDAGAEKVIFDVLMEFDTARWSLSGVEKPEKFKKFDLEFLLLLRKYSKDKRIILARTTTAMPAKRFHTIAGSEAIAFAELPLDGDGVIRQIPLELATKTGAHARTLIGAALQREHSP